jgi:hypothetical protein
VETGDYGKSLPVDSVSRIMHGMSKKQTPPKPGLTDRSRAELRGLAA